MPYILGTKIPASGLSILDDDDTRCWFKKDHCHHLMKQQKPDDSKQQQNIDQELVEDKKEISNFLNYLFEAFAGCPEGCCGS